MEAEASSWDVAVVGAGYAGLAAGLSLCRHRLNTVLFDGGAVRNTAALEVHGYLGLPGRSAAELVEIGRRQVTEVGGRIESSQVIAAEPITVDGELGFRLEADDGRAWTTKRLLLATGVRDLIPDIEGFSEFYGRSVHVCPHCDAYEWRDQPIAIVAWNDATRAFASKLSHWSQRLTVVTDGRRPEMSAAEQAHLERRGIQIKTGTVSRFEGRDGRLEGLRFTDGELLPVKAAFFNIGEQFQTALAEKLGCRLSASGAIQVDAEGHTSVEGVWAAGDVTGDSQFIPVAAASGLKGALDIYRTLAPTEPETHPA
ncbi:MAG: NAD(P)/FAD-dependent oxidoreductase [Chloroflexi bacterium]|nr:NAD(P)/FAD-dependent oxidoreductase [Chloroflexota bacterium]